MAKITDASTTEFILAEETEYGVRPSPLIGKKFGITGEGLAPNLTTVMSEELNPNPDVMDNLLSSVDAGGDVNYEVGAGEAMRLLLAHALRSGWVDESGVNTLRAGSAYKSMTLLKIFQNQSGRFPFSYTGSRVNSLAFDIKADGGIITSTANFTSKMEAGVPMLAVYQIAEPPLDGILTPVGALLIDNEGTDVNKLFGFKDGSWLQCGSGQQVGANTLTAGETITAGNGVPTGTVASKTRYIDKDTGRIYVATDLVTWQEMYIGDILNNVPLSLKVSPNTTVMAGATLPLAVDGDYNDVYVVTGTEGVDPDAGKIFQKLNREAGSEWTQIAWMIVDSGFTHDLYYDGMELTAKDTETKMHIPQFKNIAVTGFGDPLCFTDLGFTVNNNCEAIKGMCTENQVYPWLSAVEVKYGSREITGNATILFGDTELYEEFFKQGKELGLKFSMENGNGYGWEFEFPRIKFSEGSVNAGGKSENIEIPLKWVALYSQTEGCAMIVREITP